MGFIGNLIGNIIGIIGGAILGVVVAIFSTLNIQIPSGFATAFTTIASYFSYANGFLPMGTILICGLWFLAVFLLKYKINLFLHTIFPFIPIIGKHVNLPTAGPNEIKK